MRKILSLFAVLAVLASAGLSQAATNVWYNPSTGNLAFNNELGAVIDVFYVQSASGALSGSPLDIPGATTDPGDLPTGLTYLSVPAGTHHVGVVAAKNLAAGDLTAAYYEPFGPGAQPVSVPVLFVPEPATFAIAGLGLVGIVAAARRKS